MTMRGRGLLRRSMSCVFILFVLTVVTPGWALAGESYDGRFDPDNEPSSMTYDELVKEFGPVARPKRKWKIGAVLKFLGNSYWQAVAEGMEMKAREFGLMIDVSAGSAELDEAGQLATMEAMVARNYDAILISPQKDNSLAPAIERARQRGIFLVTVADAVPNETHCYVGPNHYEAGARAARYFMERVPQGGKVALIKGPQGVYSVRKSTEGFIETLPGNLFEVAAQVQCDWDLQTALQSAASILTVHPDLKGFYCNSDIMALGVAQAVKTAEKTGEVLVIGTDGIDMVYNAIYGGSIAGTVHSFPYETGRAAVEIALRILGKQRVPRVIRTPQEFISLASEGKGEF